MTAMPTLRDDGDYNDDRMRRMTMIMRWWRWHPNKQWGYDEIDVNINDGNVIIMMMMMMKTMTGWGGWLWQWDDEDDNENSDGTMTAVGFENAGSFVNKIVQIF